MIFLRFAWRNLQGSTFRSAVIFLCAALMAGFSTSATLLIRGAEDSLNLALNRLGADIIVVPGGTAPMMENAFLMGIPASIWMSRSALEQIREIPGVSAASPQLYLSTLRGATCCSVPEMFLIAYDPETDFTLKPWLESHISGGMGVGDVVGGRFVYVPADQDRIYVYGFGTNLRGNLDATGTGIDQTMFFTFDTALEISRLSEFQAERKMEIPEDSISAVLVKVEPGADSSAVAAQIRERVEGVSPVENANLFRSQRTQILSLLRSVLALLVIIWVLSMSLIGLVFSIAVNERRREVGVLRALGATRRFVFGSILSEGVILSLTGGLAGILLSGTAIYLFKHLIVKTLELPFFIPSPLVLVGWAIVGLGFALVSVVLSALPPVLRIALMDPAIAMRE